ncbi:MAG: crossover junction endodeoxyribonuclease RuvC [Patescibacteria group bacterium]
MNKSMPVKTPPAIILGIDPGYDRIGWAVGQKKAQSIEVLGYGLIQTDSKTKLSQRYQQIQQELSQVIKQYQPQICAIEKLFFAQNKTTALKVSEARGVIVITAISHHLAIREFSPQKIKLCVTGYGKADKKAVTKMLRIQLKLPAGKLIDDVTDALAVVLTASFMQNQLVE